MIQFSNHSEDAEKLEKQILATIAYYDILDYPLTTFEIFLYLINWNLESPMSLGDKFGIPDASRGQVWNLDNSLGGNQKIGGKNRDAIYDLRFTIYDLLDNSGYLKKYISQKYGFYFLKSRESANRLYSPKTGTMGTAKDIDIVQQRLRRKKIADQKWKKAKKICWIMQVVPFQKMVLVSGSLALGNSREDSDIDVIIIAKKGRIWIVRTFITLLTSILGVRRYKSATKDKICLNHYVTDKTLKIPFESLYNAQSYVHLVSVYSGKEDRKMFRLFQQENEWIKKYVQNYKFSELGSFRSIKRSRPLGLVSTAFEFIFSGEIGNYLEKTLSKIQSGRIKKDPLCRKKGGRITVSEDQIEFHPDSHESYIIPEFNRRMERFGLLEFANQRDSGLN